MKYAIKESILLSHRDLPSVKTDYLNALNLIHSQQAFKVQVKQALYQWCWQYPIVDTTNISLTLQCENSEYWLHLGKIAIMSDSAQTVRWNDYESEVACILFSAIHDDLISILEQSLDDQLSVTGIKSSPTADDADNQFKAAKDLPRLGFSISGHSNHCLVEGMINLPASQLSRLEKICRPAQQPVQNKLPDVAIWLPLIIDCVDLSCAELNSLAVNSVIRLHNSSLMETKSHVALAMGSKLLNVDTCGTQGEINCKTNDALAIQSIQAEGKIHDITQH